MRITNKQITGTFITNYNKSLEDLNKLSLRVSTGLAYQKASEDPVNSLKSMMVKNDLNRNDLYQANLTDVSGYLTEAETGIKEINSILTDAYTQILQGQSDSYTSDRSTIATTLRNYQAEILSVANTKYTDKYIFGGAKMSEKPFTLDTNGALYYQGQNVDTTTDFGDESSLFDVGLGFSVDSSGAVQSGTAFDISNPGSSLLGTGTDSNGITNNIYNLLGKIADMFDNNDMTNMEAYASKLDDLKNGVLVKYTAIGQKSNFVSFLTDRYASTETNLKAKQTDVEDADSAQATLDYTSQKDAYNAALKMGAQIIQMTLLDYMS